MTGVSAVPPELPTVTGADQPVVESKDRPSEIAEQTLSSPAAATSSSLSRSTSPASATIIDLRGDLKTAKDGERGSILKAYQKARVVGSFKIEGLTGRVEKISTDTVARAILRRAKLKGIEISYVDAQAAATKLLNSEQKQEAICVGAGAGPALSTKEEAVKLYNDAKWNEALAKKKLQKDYDELCTILTELDKVVLNEGKKKPADVNKKILLLLRKAIRSQAYVFLCKDESIPAIAYLHRMVMASFIMPTPLSDYQTIGESTYAFARKKVEAAFSSILKFLRDAGKKARLTARDNTASYALENWPLAFSAIQSQMPSLGPVFGRLLGEYDPKMGENASGTMFTEKMRVGEGVERDMAFIYAPTPTVGNEVSPEAEAFLQALENRQFMSPERLAQEPSYAQHTHWAFSSLQIRGSKNEGKRVEAIMALNVRFPLSFTGITVTQDSEFYKDGVRGSSDGEIMRSEIKHGKTPLNEEYKKQMKDQLINDKGYYFPEGGQGEAFKSACGAIVDKAYDIVMRSPPPKKGDGESDTKFAERKCLWQWRQKAAFRELVNLGVMRYWQLQSLPKQGMALATSCCKECIDRGGKTMAEFLWALGDGSEGSLKQVFASLQGRALLARNRIILPGRLEPFIALTEFVSQNVAHDFLASTVGEQLQPPIAQTSAAQPALGEQLQPPIAQTSAAQPALGKQLPPPIAQTSAAQPAL